MQLHSILILEEDCCMNFIYFFKCILFVLYLSDVLFVLAEY
jgi:hypothetical protein